MTYSIINARRDREISQIRREIDKLNQQIVTRRLDDAQRAAMIGQRSGLIDRIVALESLKDEALQQRYNPDPPTAEEQAEAARKMDELRNSREVGKVLQEHRRRAALHAGEVAGAHQHLMNLRGQLAAELASADADQIAAIAKRYQADIKAAERELDRLSHLAA